MTNHIYVEQKFQPEDVEKARMALESALHSRYIWKRCNFIALDSHEAHSVSTERVETVRKNLLKQLA